MKIFYITFIKRIFDLIIATLLLLITAPILLVSIFLLLGLNKSGSVFFKQIRPGKDGKLFIVFKLKTMNDNHENGKLLSDEQRTTKIGAIVRRFSIDELPQLWNVIIGEMSLIGPRPLLVEYMKYYSPEQKRRHNVLPGISGWAQVHGRNSLSFEDRFKLDVWYVDNISLKLDFYIFCRTIVKILRTEGVLAQDPNRITDLK